MRTQALVAVSFMLTGCFDLVGPPSRDEVASATSPDGALVAVLFETNGGATTSFGYEIELRHSPQNGGNSATAGKLYGATRSACSYGVNLHWPSSNELAVEFMEADTTAIPSTIEVGGRTVVMSTRSNVSDETAPCGGMLVNRR